jgi:hypothetical protein
VLLCCTSQKNYFHRPGIKLQGNKQGSYYGNIAATFWYQNSDHGPRSATYKPWLPNVMSMLFSPFHRSKLSNSAPSLSNRASHLTAHIHALIRPDRNIIRSCECGVSYPASLSLVSFVKQGIRSDSAQINNINRCFDNYNTLSLRRSLEAANDCQQVIRASIAA